MQPINDSFSFVILGAWNHRIFSERWVASYLLSDERANVELAYPIGDPSLPNRLVFDDMVMFASPSFVKLTPREQNAVSLARCQAVVQKILDTLPHTPVSALGINFGFLEEEPGEDVLRHAKLDELLQPVATYDHELSEFELKRSFGISTEVVLNHTLKAKPDRGLTFEFNYHYANMDVGKCTEILDREVIPGFYDDARQLMRSLYDVQLPE